MTRDETPRDPLREAAQAVLDAWHEPVMSYTRPGQSTESGMVLHLAPRFDALRAAIASSTQDALDVEALAEAMAARFNDEGWHLVMATEDGGLSMGPLPDEMVTAIATEYTAVLARGQQ